MIESPLLDGHPGDALPNPHGDASSARQRLALAGSDDAALARLRGTALALGDGSDLSRCDDAALLDGLAAAWVAGRLQPAGRQAPVLRQLVVAQPPPAAPAPAPAAAPRAPEVVAPPPDDAFGIDLDVGAMVAALQQAARDGVPFCEECERAKAEQRAAAAAAA